MAQTMEVGVLVEGDSAAGADAAGLFARFWALADLDPAKYTTQGFDAQSRVTLKVPCWSGGCRRRGRLRRAHRCARGGARGRPPR